MRRCSRRARSAGLKASTSTPRTWRSKRALTLSDLWTPSASYPPPAFVPSRSRTAPRRTPRAGTSTVALFVKPHAATEVRRHWRRRASTCCSFMAASLRRSAPASDGLYVKASAVGEGFDLLQSADQYASARPLLLDTPRRRTRRQWKDLRLAAHQHNNSPGAPSARVVLSWWL